MLPQFSVIFLAGGTGNRMQSTIPKQFLPLKDKCLALHSLEVLLKMPETAEVIVVCAPNFRHYFDDYPSLKWALPGNRRQDSVYNGLQATALETAYICVHDGCRPFINESLVRRVFDAAQQVGASAAGMPVRFTVKEVDKEGLVTSTPKREFFWEIQTPQIVKTSSLKAGFANALRHQLTVTDDTSLVEHLGLPVKLVEGSYTNIKMTTPDHLTLAKNLMEMST